VAEQRFANFTWQSRWNNASGDSISVVTSRKGPWLVASGFFGTLKCLLNNDDVPTIVNHVRQFADTLEGMKKTYDGTWEGE
jgi:hypothetical protein